MPQYSSDLQISASTSDRARPRARGLRHILALGPIGLLILLTGCGSVTVFQSGFNTNTIGAPPAHNQTTGTIDVSGAPGSVVIVSPPPNATGNWARISRASDQGAPVSTMACNLSQSLQDGSYSLLAVLFIPTGSGLATLEFDTASTASPPSAGFLHLDFGDFTQKNTVRINDGSQTFGTFPRDQFFTVAVNLDITSSSANAHIDLYGSGASGTQDVNIVNNVTPLSLPRQFGAVKFFMGFPWSGSFDVSNILVTRKK